MRRHIFIVLPAPVAAGPIKGGFALANALVSERAVTLVTLKRGDGALAELDERVTQVSLAAYPGLRAKAGAYRRLLQAAGGRAAVASISMCLSADAVNLFCRKLAVTCASVRGNLPQNYRMDYGLVGLPIAAAHLAALRGVDHIVAMTRSMAQQVARFAGDFPHVIGNFVDEASLDRFRMQVPAGPQLRFAFVGSLTTRKQPLLALEALERLRRQGHDATLDIIGSGPLHAKVGEVIRRLGLTAHVRLHGFQENPYPLLAAMDAMVLPSLSEGVSRACLEALHLGVPCVLRDADGNGELLSAANAGRLFRNDGELDGAMMDAAALARRGSGSRVSLLPAGFRQQVAARAYLALVEGER